MSDLVHCQQVVERMLRDDRTLAEVEEYIERCALARSDLALRARSDREGGAVDAGLGAPGPGHTTAPCQRDARARQQHAQNSGLEHLAGRLYVAATREHDS